MRHISIKQLVKEQLESKIVSSQVFIATTVDSKYPMSLLICAELNYTDVIPDKKNFQLRARILNHQDPVVQYTKNDINHRIALAMFGKCQALQD